MNKKPNTVRPIGAKPTEEEIQENAKRAFYQKRNSLAEIILANAVQSGVGSKFKKVDFKKAVDASIEAADYFMEKAYAVSIKVGEVVQE